MENQEKNRQESTESAGEKEVTKKELEEKENKTLEEYGQMTLDHNKSRHNIHLLSIIGEVEGHENLSGSSKATKYDHVLPKLAEIEDDKEGRRRRRACHCGNDCFFKYSNGISGFGRKPFNWSPPGSGFGLFLYCAYRNYDDSSGENERDGYRSISDLRIF